MAVHPQKQTIAIFIVCVLVVAGVAFYVFHEKDAQGIASQASFQSVNVSASSSPSIIATNADWRKQFLSTTTASFAAPKNTAAQTDPQSQTATYRLGENFLTQYLILRQSGQNTNSTAVDATMSQVASQSADSLEGPKAYTAAQISVVNDTAAARNAYASIFNAVSARYESNGDEADIAASAFENDDMTRLAALDPIILNYKQMIASLLSARVPKPLLAYHLNLLNGLSALEYSSEAFRHMDTDSVKAFAAIKIDAIGTQAAGNMFSMISQNLQGSPTQ
jgi:hypothetical protein